MALKLRFRRGLGLLWLVALLVTITPLAAFTYSVDAAPISAYDLIAAVNGLRSARGLAPLVVNSSLMNSAQNHSNYQASIRAGTHIGPGGTHPIDRARAAGYGAGAYIAVAENITQYKENTPDILSRVIYQDWSDDLHMNTMLNTGLQHIGAGVAVVNNIVYLTVDTGWVTGPLSPTRVISGTPPTQAPKPTTIPLVALVTNTPRPDGSVVHVVGYGQVLVNIAAAYGVKPAEIAAWNGITPDAIYAGQRLLVHVPSTKTPNGFIAPTPTVTTHLNPNPSLSATPGLPTLPPTKTPTSSAAPNTTPLASLPVETSLITGSVALNTQATLSSNPPDGLAWQPSPTQIAILVTIACGLLGVLWVSLRRK